MVTEQIAQYEQELYDFDAGTRAIALRALAALGRTGAIPLAAEADLANMHCHTFFSFNALGHSPSSLAWLGKRKGYRLMGIVDFDVLDGVDEFLDACQTVALRASAGIETRVFVPEYAEQEINSPGEPGVCYHMGIGFTASTVPESVASILADLGWRADRRNQAILDRVNAYLDPVAIDYERDVLPLTPAGHPTERHMVAAYIDAARRAVADDVTFWAGRLAMPVEEMAAVMTDAPRFQNLIRAKLMKQGSVGYVQPESGMFPAIEDFHELIVACGALPCAAWLDGTTEVEKDPEAWLGFLVEKGVAALNIIPDRNWNIADPAVRQAKVRNLYRVVEVAQALDLPLNAGTEMNSFGQKPVDDFDAPELAPVRQSLLDGAHFIYGHTVMQGALGLGYQSTWARDHLPGRRQRNEFFARAGHVIPPGQESFDRLRHMGPTLPPETYLAQWN